MKHSGQINRQQKQLFADLILAVILPLGMGIAFLVANTPEKEFIMIVIFLAWLVLTLSFLIILELPLGLEIDGFNKGTLAALIFGGFNTTLHPIFIALNFPGTFFTFGFFVFLINTIFLVFAAIFIKGFYLNGGGWSILTSLLALSIVNSILFKIFTLVSE